MPRPPLAPGVPLLLGPANDDEWTWATARPLLPPGTIVRRLGAEAPVSDLGHDGVWRDAQTRDVVDAEALGAVIVEIGPGGVREAAAPAGELVALPAVARPELPAALDAEDDPVEVQVRDTLVEAAARSIEVLVADVRAHPERALRRLRVIERVSHVLREGVAELGLDDEGDEGVGGYGDAGMVLGDGGPRRRRRRPGFAGGHAYGGQMDQQTMLNGAVRAQHMQALTQTIERTAPNGTAPNAAIHAAATQELATLFPGAELPPPAVLAPGEPPDAGGATIPAPIDGAPA